MIVRLSVGTRRRPVLLCARAWRLCRSRHGATLGDEDPAGLGRGASL